MMMIWQVRVKERVNLLLYEHDLYYLFVDSQHLMFKLLMLCNSWPISTTLTKFLCNTRYYFQKDI